MFFIIYVVTKISFYLFTFFNKIFLFLNWSIFLQICLLGYLSSLSKDTLLTQRRHHPASRLLVYFCIQFWYIL